MATLSLLPGKLTFKFKKGSTFRPVLTLTDKATAQPLDLTGCTARMHVRSEADASQTLHTLDTETATADGVNQIVLGGAAGTVALRITAAESSAFDWLQGVYDLEIVWPDGTVTSYLEGTMIPLTEVTR